MKRAPVLFASAVLLAGYWALNAQQPAAGGVFTAAQAERGHVLYTKTCGQCHTPSLLGRRGVDGELPPMASLIPRYRDFIGVRGTVPPLAGDDFMAKWGSMTAAQLIARFQETVDFFSLEEDKETTVDITAYVLQVNGAKAGTQALTRGTDAVVRSVSR